VDVLLIKVVASAIVRREGAAASSVKVSGGTSWSVPELFRVPAPTSTTPPETVVAPPESNAPPPLASMTGGRSDFPKSTRGPPCRDEPHEPRGIGSPMRPQCRLLIARLPDESPLALRPSKASVRKDTATLCGWSLWSLNPLSASRISPFAG
jgi:hypothetical protein